MKKCIIGLLITISITTTSNAQEYSIPFMGGYHVEIDADAKSEEFDEPGSDLTWGISQEELLSAFPETKMYGSETGKAWIESDTVFNSLEAAYKYYYFKEDALYMTNYVIPLEGYTSASALEWYSALINELSNEYGKPCYSNGKEENETTTLITEDLISKTQRGIQTSWTTGKDIMCTCQLFLDSDTNNYFINIFYVTLFDPKRWNNETESSLAETENDKTQEKFEETETEPEPEILKSGNYRYYVNEDETLTLHEWTGDERALKIPKELDGKEITRIGHLAFFYNSSIERIDIPDSVTTIEQGAITSCRNLIEVKIPESVKTIEAGAISYCESLPKIKIPGSVTTIEGNPFTGCENLAIINIALDHDKYFVNDNVLFDKDNTLICYPCGLGGSECVVPMDTRAIGDQAFEGYYKLESIVIPDSVTSIGDAAFAGCDGLTSITIPESVTMIGDKAFVNCDNLSSVEILGSITTIGEKEFDGCKNLSSITIPDSVTMIGAEAFNYCENLRTIDLPNSLKMIGDDAFSCSGLYSIEIPDSVATIDNNPFYACRNLNQISISPDHETYAVIDNVLFDKKKKALVCHPIGLSDNEYIIPVVSSDV